MEHGGKPERDYWHEWAAWQVVLLREKEPHLTDLQIAVRLSLVPSALAAIRPTIARIQADVEAYERKESMTVVRKSTRMATPSTISPKALLALVLPAAGTLVLALVNEFAAPHMSSTLKIAVVGVVNALLAAAGAYVGKPGQVVVQE